MTKGRKFIRRYSLIMALRQTIAVGIGYVVGYWFGGLIKMPMPIISGLWCAISTLLVLEAEIEKSFKQGWLRIIGSIAGAITSFIIASIFGYHFWSLLISIYLTVVCVSLVRLNQTIRIAVLTVLVIMIIGISDPSTPPLLNSLSRLTESIIGVLIAIVFVWAFSPVSRWIKLE